MFERIYDMFGFSPAKLGERYGLELELEQVEGVNGTCDHLARVEEDNSLRNSGQEFISHAVSRTEALDFFVEVMYSDKVNWLDKSQRCTERGSIHVHVNVQDMTEMQVLNMLRFYCYTEPQWFAEVAPHRQNNIYCVPLYATAMPRYLHTKPIQLFSAVWHKYTALNAKPIDSLGTLEFRHLQATEQLATLDKWLGYIENLRRLAIRIPSADLSWSDVMMLHHDIFRKPPSDAVLTRLCYEEDVINRQSFQLVDIVQRIKESKVCAASSV